MTFQEAKAEAYETAIDSLARYKFMMFGYWAAIWVHLNQLDSNKEPNPFKGLVEGARLIQQRDAGQMEANWLTS
jgi:hypothetical protein